MKILILSGCNSLKKFEKLTSKQDFDLVISLRQFECNSNVKVLSLSNSNTCTWLGTDGIFTCANGLRIAYLSGIYDENAFKLEIGNEIYYSKNSIDRLMKIEDPVDILITLEWPRLIQSQSTFTDLKGDGQQCIADIATKLAPRYHFTSQYQFFEREPYSNLTAKHVTRFISLAEFGNPLKERWYYAININPMKSIPLSELNVQPSNVTKFPFINLDEEMPQKKIKLNYDESLLCRACGERGHSARKCPKAPGKNPHALALKRRDPTKCWFCLSNPEVETHLIVAVINQTYLTLAKGGLVERHTIIVPVGHVPSTRALQVLQLKSGKEGDDALATLTEVDRIIGHVDAIERTLDSFIVAFEIFGGLDPTRPQDKLRHMHVQLVALPIELEDVVYDAFRNQAKAENLQEMQELPESPYDPFLKVSIIGQPLLVFIPPDSSKLDHEMAFEGYKRKRQAYFNLQNPRQVIAGLLGQPLRADWKYCIVGEESETSQTMQIQKLYQGLE